MRAIPIKIRLKLAQDPEMGHCVYENSDAPNNNCNGRIEFEHAFIYSGRQISEEWAIIACCTAHNRSSAMVKDYNQYRGLLKAKRLGVWYQIKAKYPKFDWDQLFNYLHKKYAGQEKN